MASLLERIIEGTIYAAKEPPPRTRDPNKPLQVICVGFPRSATESLSVALKKLGYDYTYHGWDILFEDDHRMQGWVRLCRKKWYGPGDGETNLTRADFDALMGHAVACVDAPASVFAADLITLFPEAKVVLNIPRDMDRWHASAIDNIALINESWRTWFESLWSSTGYWSWVVYGKYMWLLLFRATHGNVSNAIRRNGKWIYREHISMIRGLVPPERMLEWSVDEGWQPLCKFLGKPVPTEPFPNTNNAAGFERRVQQWFDANKQTVRKNQTIAAVLVVGLGMYTSWKVAPAQTLHFANQVQNSFNSFTGFFRG